MKMAVIFGMNQVVSHGFGIFLFAALVPLMRESISLSHWHLAAIGALTQLAYLGGAMLVGLLGHRLGTSRLSLMSATLTTVLLFTMSQLENPLLITLVLTGLAASASISWVTIVEIISRYARCEQRSTYLSTASSGTAWGYGLNGLMILLVVPVLGWQHSWQIAGGTGILVVGLTWYLLQGLKKPLITPAQFPEFVIPPSKLLLTICRESTAMYACLVCLLVGFTSMPFANWFNTYLDQLALPVALGGYTWAVAGITGMMAGVLTGWLADNKGHGVALLVTLSGFALGLLAFIYDPGRFALMAGFGYGLMYFPMWGILAGWIGQTYSSTATMQISGIGMVCFGFGGTLGNLVTGYIRDITGSLEAVFVTLAVASVLLVILALRIMSVGHKSRPMQQAV